jgi:hypothetical protein
LDFIAAGHSQILSDEVASSTPRQEHKKGLIVIGDFVIIFRKKNQVSDQWPPFPC